MDATTLTERLDYLNRVRLHLLDQAAACERAGDDEAKANLRAKARGIAFALDELRRPLVGDDDVPSFSDMLVGR